MRSQTDTWKKQSHVKCLKREIIPEQVRNESWAQLSPVMPSGLQLGHGVHCEPRLRGCPGRAHMGREYSQVTSDTGWRMQHENGGEITYMKPHHNCFRAQHWHTALLLYFYLEIMWHMTLRLLPTSTPVWLLHNTRNRKCKYKPADQTSS